LAGLPSEDFGIIVIALALNRLHYLDHDKNKVAETRVTLS